MSDATTPPTNDAKLCVGDRVVLTDLKSAKRLNGRHGAVVKTVAEDRYKVDLDLPSPIREGGNSTAIAVRAANLRVESEIPPEAQAKRAEVRDGICLEAQGRSLSLLLDLARYIVGHMFTEDPEIEHMHDIDRLKDVSMVKANYLSSMAWTYWADPGQFESTGGRGVYHSVRDFFRDQVIPQGFGSLAEAPPEYRRAYDALEDVSAAAGWNVRVNGDFWIVSDPVADDGTYCVLAKSLNTVYKIVGMSTNLGSLISRAYGQGAIARHHLTAVPWYGRLVYDGMIVPTGAGGEFHPRPQIADATKARKIRDAIRRAESDGRVITRLNQLEIPGGSIVGANPLDISPLSRTNFDSDDDGGGAQQPEPSIEEARLVDAIHNIDPYPGGVNNKLATWTFRRSDYTEEENPEHKVAVIHCDTSFPDQIIGTFNCSELEPTSVEVLEKLVEFSKEKEKRPNLINLDERACFDRVKFLLRDINDMHFMYYLPPSKEEQAANWIARLSGVDLTS